MRICVRRVQGHTYILRKHIADARSERRKTLLVEHLELTEQQLVCRENVAEVAKDALGFECRDNLCVSVLGKLAQRHRVALSQCLLRVYAPKTVPRAGRHSAAP